MTNQIPQIQIAPGFIVVQGVILSVLSFIILAFVDFFGHHHYLQQMLTALTPTGAAITFGTLMGIPFFLFGELCSRLHTTGFPTAAQSTATFLAPTSTKGYLAMAASAGISEELLLRGCIQAFAGVWIANTLFAALHFTGKQSLPYVVVTFMFGLILSAIYIGTGNLWCCIMCHVVNNFLSHTLAVIVRHFQSEISADRLSSFQAWQ